jgi:uncharacterized protein YbgA (DUF1722 family)/uncharacterized protein YbbK (DUF523 family)
VSQKIRIGISSCLLGENVRYNGGNSKDRYITDTLSEFFDFYPVCPEVECGFGVPRESLRLVGDPAAPRLMTSRTGVDHTDKMLAWAGKRVRELEQEALCGFIFMKNSPSSGMQRVRVYTERGMPSRRGVGMFARAFMENFPLIPVEENGRLNDPGLRANFVERVFVFRRWRKVLEGKRNRGRLVNFHTRHKLLIMSHSQEQYRAMGRLVAEQKTYPIAELHDRYQDLLMNALRLKTTVKKNTNVLMHIQGYFKKQLSADEKQETLEIIHRYHDGYVPLIVPVTLLNHYVRKYDQPYLKEQYYLNPHPMELKLRNHA